MSLIYALLLNRQISQHHMYVLRDVSEISKGKFVMKSKIISKIMWGGTYDAVSIKIIGCLMYNKLEGCS